MEEKIFMLIGYIESTENQEWEISEVSEVPQH